MGELPDDQVERGRIERNRIERNRLDGSGIDRGAVGTAGWSPQPSIPPSTAWCLAHVLGPPVTSPQPP